MVKMSTSYRVWTITRPPMVSPEFCWVVSTIHYYGLYWVIMPKYVVLCPSCNLESLSYEKYIRHVYDKHEVQPSLRMQAKIIKKEID